MLTYEIAASMTISPVMSELSVFGDVTKKAMRGMCSHILGATTRAVPKQVAAAKYQAGWKIQKLRILVKQEIKFEPDKTF